mmetsp:Transcript_17841/g.62618  ORF Transcript_17841/g.62618 Transcript_17841/m.62618 type:complete len:244 (-) Transcript_17841:16-747(-)
MGTQRRWRHLGSDAGVQPLSHPDMPRLLDAGSDSAHNLAQRRHPHGACGAGAGAAVRLVVRAGVGIGLGLGLGPAAAAPPDLRLPACRRPRHGFRGRSGILLVGGLRLRLRLCLRGCRRRALGCGVDVNVHAPPHEALAAQQRPSPGHRGPPTCGHGGRRGRLRRRHRRGGGRPHLAAALDLRGRLRDEVLTVDRNLGVDESLDGDLSRMQEAICRQSTCEILWSGRRDSSSASACQGRCRKT